MSTWCIHLTKNFPRPRNEFSNLLQFLMPTNNYRKTYSLGYGFWHLCMGPVLSWPVPGRSVPLSLRLVHVLSAHFPGSPCSFLGKTFAMWFLWGQSTLPLCARTRSNAGGQHIPFPLTSVIGSAMVRGPKQTNKCSVKLKECEFRPLSAMLPNTKSWETESENIVATWIPYTWG